MDPSKKSQGIVITDDGFRNAEEVEVVIGLEDLTFFEPGDEPGNEQVA